MRSEVFTTPLRFVDDESVLCLGIGGWGERVVDILRREFERLRIPDDRQHLLVWNPRQRQGKTLGAIEFESFDAAAYVAHPENETLRSAVAGVDSDILAGPAEAWSRAPEMGLVALHHEAEERLVPGVGRALDTLRNANPEGRLRCLVIGSLSDGIVSGSLASLLFLLRDSFKLRKVGLEVFVATGEGQADSLVVPEIADRNALRGCLEWQRLGLGDGQTTYPGRAGNREDRKFAGPLVEHTTIFSGGIGASPFSPSAQASIVAGAILALESTPLAQRLEQRRDHDADEAFDRGWQTPSGETRPSRLTTMSVGGLKGDVLPAVFHLRSVRDFVTTVTRALHENQETSLHAAAEKAVTESRLHADLVVEDLQISRDPLTFDEMRAADVPGDQLHAFVKRRLDEDLDGLLQMATTGATPATLEVVLEQARVHIGSRAIGIANGSEGWLSGAIRFYANVEKQLHGLRNEVLHRSERAREELGNSPSRARLDNLLRRLEADTGHAGVGMVGRFVTTMAVAPPIQVRKILEVAQEVRRHALLVGTAGVLQHFYDKLLHYCERQRQDLQGLVQQLNTTASVCAREEEQLLRSARSAFMFHKDRLQTVADALWQRARTQVGTCEPGTVVERLGGDLPSLSGRPNVFERLLEALRPEAEKWAAAGEDLVSKEPAVRDAVQEARLQLLPTLRIDRDMAGLHTIRRHFVLCTDRVYRKLAGVLEDFEHVETRQPWNVLLSEHEDGFPFAAVEYLQRAQAKQDIRLD